MLHDRKATSALSKEMANVDLSTALPLAVTSGIKPPHTVHSAHVLLNSAERLKDRQPLSCLLRPSWRCGHVWGPGFRCPLRSRPWLVLGITGVSLEPEQQPKAANPLSLLIRFLSASSPCHHAALSGLKGQHRQESHVTQHQTKTKQKPSSAEH